MNASGPLSGIRIIEVCHMLAGPYCAMLLADLGAEVIKVEDPSNGDFARVVGPHHVGPHNTYFASLNRGKKSVCLDLRTEAGQSGLKQLATGANALITNVRPRAIKKLGLTYADMSRHNPNIVCLALTGFGLDGPFADKPAYDYIIQALAGVMVLTGEPGGPPVKTGYSVVDNSIGILGAVGLLAKLVEGRGGQIDISLFDGMLSQLNYIASAYLNAGEVPQPMPGGGHPYLVPAQIFETADGYLALFISHEDFWRRFADAMSRPEWLTDRRFATMAERVRNRTLVVDTLTREFQKRPTQVWLDLLEPLGLVVAGVQSLDQAVESPLARSRGMIVQIETSEGPLRLIGNPIKVDGAAPPCTPPPLLGQHTRQVLGA